MDLHRTGMETNRGRRIIMDLELYRAFETEIGRLRADILYKEVLIKKLQEELALHQSKESEGE